MSHVGGPTGPRSQARSALRVAAIALAVFSGCQPVARSGARDWAEIPMAGVGSSEVASLTTLRVDPDAYRGKTVRLAVRVVTSHRDARGVWLRVVEAGAPAGSAYVKFLIPKEQDGEEFLETAGREMDLLVRIDRPTATMAFESAFEITPLAHVTRFSSSSRGGEDAAEIRDDVGDVIGEEVSH